MADIKIIQGRPSIVGLSDTRPVSGGVVVRDEFLSSADQVTIGGDGSAERPLHLIGGSPSTDPTLTTIIAAANLLPGMPVYSSSGGVANKARANAQGTVAVFGLASELIAIGDDGSVKTVGPLTLTTAEWDALTGDVGGLIFGDWYYVSAAIAGHLVHDPNAPTGVGEFVVGLGQAISATTLNLNIQKAEGPL